MMLRLTILTGLLSFSLAFHAHGNASDPARQAGHTPPLTQESDCSEPGSQDKEADAEPCTPASAADGTQPTSPARPSRQQVHDDRHTASTAASENLMDEHLLRELMHGRQLIFFGRLEPELAMYHVPALMGESGPGLRRFRMGIAGINPRWENISYKFELDLTDSNNTLAGAYLNWDWRQYGALTLGYQDVVQNLSAQTGSLSQLFMEAPQPVDTFSLSKRLGISYDLFGERSGIHAMAFGRDPNNDNDTRGYAGRAYFNPHRSGHGIFHLGGALVWENLDETVRLRSRPESHVTDVRLVDTGTFNDVDTQIHFSLEAAGAKRAFTTRMELFQTYWERTDGSRNTFNGAYWEGGYFLTGQSFNYRQGKFVRPHLIGPEGAWELGLRLSWVELNDADVNGGEERNAGIAVNYYPRSNLRGQFNFIQVNADQPGGDGYLAQWRLQWNW